MFIWFGTYYLLLPATKIFPQVWDVNEMICETNYLAAHSRQITGVAVKANSTSFATGSLDRHVSLWDKSSKEKITGVFFAYFFTFNSLL